MEIRGRLRVRSLAFLIMLLLDGCAPAQNAGVVAPSAPSEQSQVRQSAPKTVTIGIQREPYALDQAMVGGASLTAGGASNVPPILHDYLSVPVGIEGREAHLAVELPSVEKGSWRTNADGTMDMTWQLRPNIKW